jgi:hypothetical protein
MGQPGIAHKITTTTSGKSGFLRLGGSARKKDIPRRYMLPDDRDPLPEKSIFPTSPQLPPEMEPLPVSFREYLFI